MIDALYQHLRSELSSERVLSTKAAAAWALELEQEEPLDALSEEALAALEEWRLESLLSPLFTPGEEERVLCEPLLPQEGVAQADVKALMRRLSEDEVQCEIWHGSDKVELRIPEVALERYLRLLHLDQPLGETVPESLKALAAKPDRDAAQSLCRQPGWDGRTRTALLKSCLGLWEKRGGFDLDKLRYLSSFVVTYRPEDLDELKVALSNLITAYEEETPAVFSSQLAKHQLNSIRSEMCGADVKARRLNLSHALLADFSE